MAANVNKVPHTATQGSQASGTKLRPGYYKDSAGDQQVAVERFTGGPTADSSVTDTGSAMGHQLTATHAEDQWNVHPYDVDDAPAVELTGTTPSAPFWLKHIEVYNSGPDTVYVAEDNTVTSSGATQGRPIPSGAAWSPPIGAFLEIWGICDTGDTARVFVSVFA